MILDRRVVVVMPAYNAGKTLEQTVARIDRQVVDDIILVDDHSQDDTVARSTRLGLHTIRHDRNRGYGGNQKSCYDAALTRGADIVVMVHPDYQYTPALIPALAAVLASGEFDVALGSRILGGGAIRGGMPVYKYVANRLLTFAQNLFTGMKLSEYHTGYRAFTRQVLETLPLQRNSEGFLFDNQMLLQVDVFGFRIAEITCPTRYFAESSSIGFGRSVRYGLGCLWNTALHLLLRAGLYRAPIFRPLEGRPADAADTADADAAVRSGAGGP